MDLRSIPPTRWKLFSSTRSLLGPAQSSSQRIAEVSRLSSSRTLEAQRPLAGRQRRHRQQRLCIASTAVSKDFEQADSLFRLDNCFFCLFALYTGLMGSSHLLFGPFLVVLIDSLYLIIVFLQSGLYVSSAGVDEMPWTLCQLTLLNEQKGSHLCWDHHQER